MAGLTKIELIKGSRYNYKGALYEKGTHYMVRPQRSEVLMSLFDEYGAPYFKVVGQPLAPRAQEEVGTPEGEAKVVDTTANPEDEYERKVMGKSAPKTKKKTRKKRKGSPQKQAALAAMNAKHEEGDGDDGGDPTLDGIDDDDDGEVI